MKRLIRFLFLFCCLPLVFGAANMKEIQKWYQDEVEKLTSQFQKDQDVDSYTSKLEELEVELKRKMSSSEKKQSNGLQSVRSPVLLQNMISDQKVVENTYVLFSTDDLNSKEMDQSLEFQIAVPKTANYQVIETTEATSGSEVVRVFAVIDKNGDEIVYRAELFQVFVTRDLNPADWLSQVTTKNEIEVLDWRETQTKYGIVADALGREENENNNLKRFTVIKDGQYLWLLESEFSNTELKNQEPALMALSQFKLLKPSQKYSADKMRWIYLAGENETGFKFVAPSWLNVEKPKKEVAPPEGGDLSILKARIAEGPASEELLCAIVAVSGGKGHSAESIEKINLEKFKANGVVLDQEGPTHIKDYREARDEGRLISRDWSANNNSILIRSTQFVYQGRPFVLTMLSPSRHAEFSTWAHNRRAYQVMSDTVMLSGSNLPSKDTESLFWMTESLNE